MIQDQPTPPRGVPPSIPADATVLMGALQVLDVLERLPRDATGAVRFADGIVLMESGFICWASAPDMEHRLSQLLRLERDPPLPKGFLEGIYQECKGSGARLIERLLATGELSEVGLRSALFRHTAEAIAHIARSGARAEGFVPHARAGYDPRFVFSTSELIAALGARRDRVLAAASAVHLESLRVPDASGLAFVRDGALSRPVVLKVDRELGLGVYQVLDLCSWVASAFDVSCAVDASTRILEGIWNDTRSVVAWREGRVYFALSCRTRAAAARVVSTLDARLGADAEGRK